MRQHQWIHGPKSHPTLDALCQACGLEQHDITPKAKKQRVEYRREGQKFPRVPDCTPEALHTNFHD